MRGSWKYGMESVRITRLLETSMVPPERLASPTLRELLARWEAAAQDSGPPSRDDFRPEAVRRAVGRIMILQVEPGNPVRFRYRLVGMDIVNRYEDDMTGKTTDDFEVPDFAQALRAQHETVLRSGTPLCVLTLAEGARRLVAYEKVILPVSNGGTAVDQLVVCSFPIEIPGAGPQSIGEIEPPAS